MVKKMKRKMGGGNGIPTLSLLLYYGEIEALIVEIKCYLSRS
jgi:hypothetical protein